MALNLLQRTPLSHTLITNAGASGTLPIVAAAPNTFCRIYRIVLTVAGANSLQFQDTASNNLSGPLGFAAAGAIILDEQITGEPWYQATAAGLGLQLVIASANQVGGDIWYLQAP